MTSEIKMVSENFLMNFTKNQNPQFHYFLHASIKIVSIISPFLDPNCGSHIFSKLNMFLDYDKIERT